MINNVLLATCSGSLVVSNYEPQKLWMLLSPLVLFRSLSISCRCCLPLLSHQRCLACGVMLPLLRKLRVHSRYVIATFPVHALSLLKVVDVGYYTDHVLALMTHHAVGTVEINIVSQRCKLLRERFAYREY